MKTIGTAYTLAQTAADELGKPITAEIDLQRALAHLESAAEMLDEITEPRLTFERQASHYLALWLTNDEASYNEWKNTDARTAEARIKNEAQAIADHIRRQPLARMGSPLYHALAELLTRAAAWLDCDAIAAQLQED